MQYCIDTDVIISAFAGDIDSMKILNKLQDNYCVTPIVASELFKGAYVRDDGSGKKLKDVMEFIKDAGLIPFSLEASRIFGEKYAELKKIGKLTEEKDLMIAAIAIAHNSTLVTRNKKHFENITDLDVIYV